MEKSSLATSNDVQQWFEIKRESPTQQVGLSPWEYVQANASNKDMAYHNLTHIESLLRLGIGALKQGSESGLPFNAKEQCALMLGVCFHDMNHLGGKEQNDEENIAIARKALETYLNEAGGKHWIEQKLQEIEKEQKASMPWKMNTKAESSSLSVLSVVSGAHSVIEDSCYPPKNKAQSELGRVMRDLDKLQLLVPGTEAIVLEGLPKEWEVKTGKKQDSENTTKMMQGFYENITMESAFGKTQEEALKAKATKILGEPKATQEQQKQSELENNGGSVSAKPKSRQEELKEKAEKEIGNPSGEEMTPSQLKEAVERFQRDNKVTEQERSDFRSVSENKSVKACNVIPNLAGLGQKMEAREMLVQEKRAAPSAFKPR